MASLLTVLWQFGIPKLRGILLSTSKQETVFSYSYPSREHKASFQRQMPAVTRRDGRHTGRRVRRVWNVAT